MRFPRALRSKIKQSTASIGEGKHIVHGSRYKSKAICCGAKFPCQRLCRPEKKGPRDWKLVHIADPYNGYLFVHFTHFLDFELMYNFARSQIRELCVIFLTIAQLRRKYNEEKLHRS